MALTERRLGFFTRLLADRAGSKATTVYSQAGEQLLRAEQLGFDVGWVAQHHLDAREGGLPSPFVFLAWMAARTERIKLGTAIVTLALADPIRVAEDAAVLDVLLTGRVELGLGTGGSDALFRAFGFFPNQRNTLFANNFQRLTEALGDSAQPAASPRQTGACYPALRCLPGRDFHPLAGVSALGR